MISFKPNEDIQKGVIKLYGELKDKSYGTSFTWADLSEMSKVPNMTKDKIYYITHCVNNMLMRHEQKFLQTVHGMGKRIIRPNEHSVVAKKVVGKSIRIYKKAGEVLAVTNMDKLTETEKQQVIEDANKYSTLEMFASQMLKKKTIGKSSKSDIKTASLFLDAIKMFTEK